MTTCTGPDCTRTDIRARGFCDGHYRQWLRRRPLAPLLNRGCAGKPRADLIDDLESIIGTDTPEHIAQRLGIKLASIERQLYRAKRQDLWRRLNGRAAA